MKQNKEKTGTIAESWLLSCWEADLEANNDNPDPIVQYVMESFRKYLQMTDQEREKWARECSGGRVGS